MNMDPVTLTRIAILLLIVLPMAYIVRQSMRGVK
jgi:hypothetical protein